MKKHKVDTAFFIVLLIFSGIFSFNCKVVLEEDNHILVPLEQLQNIYSQIDIPSEFNEIDSYNNIRKQSSLANHFYKSSLAYSDVKDYFNTSLLSKNWVYGNEEQFEYITNDERRKRFSYKKEGCVLWVEYVGLSPTNRWNYGLSLVC